MTNQALPTIAVISKLNRDVPSMPFTYGVPLARSQARPGEHFALAGQDNQLHPAQTRPLELWPDGSVKWLLLSFQVPCKKNTETTYRLVKSHSPAPQAIRIDDDDAAITVTTNKLTVRVSKKEFSLFESYKVDGQEMIGPGSDVVIEAPTGKKFYGSNAQDILTKVIEQGPIKTVIETTGRHTAGDGETRFDFRVRYTLYSNEPGVKVSYKFTNRELPEQGVTVSSIKLLVPTTLGKQTVQTIRQANTGKHWFSREVDVQENVEVLASSAINPEAKTRYGAASDGIVIIRDLGTLREDVSQYPYFLRPGNKRTDMTGGLKRVYPHLRLRSAKGTALCFFFEMGFNHPKSVHSERGLLQLDIWPAWAGELKWRRGMSKEHDFYLALSPRHESGKDLEDLYFKYEVSDFPQLHPALDPAYVRSCGVLNLEDWLTHNEARYLAVETKLGTAGQAGETDFAPGCKGMMDFGDYINPDRSWAHNNENDAILNNLREYYRLRAPAKMRAALAAARHNAHVDFISFDPDPLRQGTMPAHCPEHTDGSTYPSHMWGDGLLAAYCITGEEDYKAAAFSVAENMLRWQKNDPTIFYADSRECGWPALLYCRMYEATGDTKWLDATDEVFRHIRDKVNADSLILYELPHGVGTHVGGYGEFIAWRALYFFHTLTGRQDVKDFLIKALKKVYVFKPGHIKMGWACNDLFPCWALYKLTGDVQVLKDNFPFLRFLMSRNEAFPWGGNDMHFYLAELDKLGLLEGVIKSN